MAEDSVTIRLRLTGAQKTAAEAHQVAAAIDEIGDEARQADRHIGGFGSAATLLSGPLRALTQSVGATTTAIGELFPRMGKLGVAAATAAPVLLGIVGALLAIAGSAGAAIAGFGALGVGGIGALAVGLFGVGIIAGQAAGNFGKVSQALDAYRLVIARYGKDSKEARDAQDALNAVVKQSGGPGMLRAVRAWRALGTEFRRSTGPARSALGGIFGSLLGGAHRLMPAFAAVTNQAARALRPVFSRMIGVLSGGEAQAGLRSLGNTFAKIAGPLGRGATSIFVAIARIARAAGPFVVRLAEGFARFGEGLAAATSNSGTVSGVIGTLVGHLKSWWELAKAIGAVMGTIFTGGAESGKGLVETLTNLTNAFNEWLKGVLPAALPGIELVVKGMLNLSLAAFRVVAAFSTVSQAMVGVFSGIGDIAVSAFELVKTTVTGILNFLIRQINTVIGAVNSLNVDTPLGNIGVGHIGLIDEIGSGRAKSSRPTGARALPTLAAAPGGAAPINVFSTLQLDGAPVAKSVTRANQKKRARK